MQDADINALGGEYDNTLQAASEGGHEQVVQMLLDKGADVNAQGGRYGNALQAASFEGHNQVVQILLDKGADVNAQGDIYSKALRATLFGGYNQVVQILLDKGADVNAQGGLYGNALYAASERGHDQVVQILLDKGADGNALLAASERGDDHADDLPRDTDDNGLSSLGNFGKDEAVQTPLQDPKAFETALKTGGEYSLPEVGAWLSIGREVRAAEDERQDAVQADLYTDAEADRRRESERLALIELQCTADATENQRQIESIREESETVESNFPLTLSTSSNLGCCWPRPRRCTSGHWRDTRKYGALSIHPHSTPSTTGVTSMLIRERLLRRRRCTGGHWRDTGKHRALSIYPHSTPSTSWALSIRIRAS